MVLEGPLVGERNGERDALQRALDLLPYGIVACDRSAALVFGNRLIDGMVGGLHPGLPARYWATEYGLGDESGVPYAEIRRIPLVNALESGSQVRVSMYQRCAQGSIALQSHARQVRDAAGHVVGAVGVFLPLRMVTGARFATLRTAAAAGPVAVHRSLLEAAVELAQEVTHGPRSNDGITDRVIEYVTPRLAEPIQLRDVAAALGYSPAHLTTLVRRRSGQPLMQLVHRLRLSAAQQLLETTDLSIEAVARRTGPWTAGYLTRAFRRSHGCSPTAWRERMR